jgi:two-component system, chemotaxis family, sensor kinase Cph1
MPKMNSTVTTILIVDDQPNNLRFLNKILTQAGYKVQKAISGKLAISAATANPPDLILLDIMMPDLSGYEVCKILKDSEKTKEIPILFLSILDTSQDKVNGFNVGGADYITKPFQVEEILVRIHHHLTLQKLQKQLKEQNNRLQQSQSLLESVLNSSIDGVSVFEAQRNDQQKITDLKWVLINQSAEKMLFKTFDELSSTTLLETFPAYLENGLFDAYISVIETGQSLITESFYQEPNHPGSWLQIAAVKLNDGLAVTFRDITERKKSEMAIKESEEKFRTIFEQAAVGICQIAISGNFLKANQRLCNLLGYSETELLQKTIKEITHPNDIQADIEYAEQILTGQRISYSIEKRFIGKNAKIIWVNFTVSVQQKSTSVNDFIAIVEDISERKIAQQQLQESLKNQTYYTEKLARSNAELEQFAYVASHDLQAPLGTIASFSQLLQRRYKDQLDNKANQLIENIVNGCIRMQTLIDDLLQYSRITTNKKPFEITDINQVFQEACANLQLAINENKAIINCSFLPTLAGERFQLIQVFQNLLGNAIKYRKNQTPTIEINALPQEKHWLFSIKDNGIGIDSKHSERIFQIFQRLHTQQEYTGTGIGLAICKKIIEHHGGEIWVNSEPNQGSTFYFTLPQHFQ